MLDVNTENRPANERAHDILRGFQVYPLVAITNKKCMGLRLEEYVNAISVKLFNIWAEMMFLFIPQQPNNIVSFSYTILSFA